MSGEFAGMGLAKRSGRLGDFLRSVFRSPLEREREFYRRYRDLSDKIAAAPDDMLYRVLRGELSLERGEYERAKADFEVALELAESLDETKGWLIVEQVMRDRALFGLRIVEDNLPASASRIN